MTDTTDEREPNAPETNGGTAADGVTSPATTSLVRPRMIVAATTILVLGVGVIVSLVLLGRGSTGDAGASEPIEIAADFVASYANRDVDAAATYLSPVVDPSLLRNEDNSDPLTVRFREATGHRITVGSCQEAELDPRGTLVECGYTYHHFRSEELGRGPFGVGSVYAVVVADGAVVAFEDHPAELSFADPEDFSRQMWRPFAAWVSLNHPEAVDVMYASEGGWDITEESIPLWEQYLTEWATELRQGS
jgi:hypothetical protein